MPTDEEPLSFDRRTWLKVSAGTFGLVAVGSTPAAADPTVEIEIQQGPVTGADFVDVTVSIGGDGADESMRIRAYEESGSAITESPGLVLEGDTDIETRLSLERSLVSGETIAVAVLPPGGSQDLAWAREESFALAEGEATEIEIVDEIEVTLVESKPDWGFNYPYLLYAPQIVEPDRERPVMVTPNNTGAVSDDLDVHLDRAEGLMEWNKDRLGRPLEVPVLVPVFPRPRSDPVDGTHYVHALDAQSIGIDSGRLERPDLQLLSMVEHAREYLGVREYPVAADGILLDGFSASGNFVERFTALHPEEVISVTAGGLNGMPLLPIAEMNGRRLRYHVGTGDIETLTGEPFDLDAFHEVNQFLYMGELDMNDTIPYSDAWSPALRETALETYGRNIRERFSVAKSVYESVDANAVFREYERAYHEPAPDADILEFHRRSIEGETVEALRPDFGGNVPELGAHIQTDSISPDIGEEVTFDGTLSAVQDREIVAYEWTFDDGETVAGSSVTRSFDVVGGHNVGLRVTDDAGETYRTVEQFTVGTTAQTTRSLRNIPAGNVDHPRSGLGTKSGIVESGASADTTTADPAIEPTFVPADPDAGFEYPYYLYAPKPGSEDGMPILLRPNTNPTSDDLDEFIDRAAERIESGINRRLSDELGAPLVLPIFPRPRSEPVDDTHYTHALDDSTMGIEDGPLERIDLQVLAMVDDARERLETGGYPVQDGLMLNGFSATGNFVERFATLHPEEVISVTAGGLNGMPILPVEETTDRHGESRSLPYHVGIANLAELTGESFDREAFEEVNRFLYMGEFDGSDTITYGDAFTRDEMRELALDVYGVHMIDDRFRFARAVYEETDANAVFRTYLGELHRPAPVSDLAYFHRRSVAGDDIDSLQADLGRNAPSARAHVEFAPREPREGEQLALHAAETTLRGNEPGEFEWFVDGQSVGTGERLTHAIEEQGTHELKLAVSTATGTHEATEYLTVEETVGSGSETDGDSDGEPEDGTDDQPSGDGDGSDDSGVTDSSEDSDVADGSGDSVDDDGPGLGVGSAVAGAAGFGYLLRQRFGKAADDEDGK